MSRSRWAWAETRWCRASVPVTGEPERLEDRSRLERRLWPGAVSVTKYAITLVVAGVLVMAAETAPALAAPRAQGPSPSEDQLVLAVGSGYAGGPAAAEVRTLQRRLERAGYTPGPTDGRFGPRTERAVTLFQSAHGLRIDGIAGPLTLAVLRAPSGILFPGAGYSGVGSGQVRRLQRQLRHDGFSPGPIDGRYGPLTERAVRRFQAAHGLRVDGVAGPHTLGELTRIAPARRPVARPKPPARRRAPQPPRPAQRAQPKPPRPGGSSWPVALVLVVILVLVALIGGRWLAGRRRDRTTGPPEPVEPRLVPGSEAQRDQGAGEGGDRLGDAAATSNLGVVLEHRGDLPGAEAAYRRADERGGADGAFNLGGFLLDRGDFEGAMAAYRRADERGDAVAAATLGALLERRGNLAAAEAAYRRADARGDAAAAAKLGMLLERQHDYHGALEAYTRAQRCDQPEVAEQARLRANALALGMSVAAERGEQ